MIEGTQVLHVTHSELGTGRVHTTACTKVVVIWEDGWRGIHDCWNIKEAPMTILRFATPPTGTQTFAVSLFQENCDYSGALVKDELLPLLLQREPIELDFSNVSFCTQSFAHALLFEAVRVSWALKVPIFITNTTPVVRTVIELVDHYAQGG